MIPNNYFAQIADHAESSPSREVCGFLLLDGKGSLEVQRAPNCALEHTRWAIHPELFSQVKRSGRLYGFYHSHFDVAETFSEPDIKSSETCLLPMFLYSVITKCFNYHRPRTIIPTLENRAFIMGVQDCASLVIDYYEVNYGIKLPFVARPPEIIEKGCGFLPEVLTQQMRSVPASSMQKDDLITFSIRNQGKENHVGIYLGEGYILHQLQGRPSDRQVLSESWKKAIVNVLRLR